MDNDDFIEETDLEDVFIIKRPSFGDDRGFFREIFRKGDLEKRLGYQLDIKQANHSRSAKGVLRGIHIAPWHKLVTVTRGEVQQVIVDLREGSATFGKHISLIAGEGNRASVFIPADCGNAFLILSEDADYTYLTTDYWSPGKEKSVIYNDPELGIAWKLDNPSLSDKDLQNPLFKQVYK